MDTTRSPVAERSRSHRSPRWNRPLRLRSGAALDSGQGLPKETPLLFAGPLLHTRNEAWPVVDTAQTEWGPMLSTGDRRIADEAADSALHTGVERAPRKRK